jgi:hypothetical protein
MYKIKELQWEDRSSEHHQYFVAKTPFGGFDVIRWWLDSKEGWGPWKWGYCFDEYYDEEQFECKSKRSGMKKAQGEWERRLKECLDEVD